MALQSSGAISLNEIHIEAGGSSGSQATINDSDIRGLIGKGSGVNMSFSEWYGAAAETVLTSGGTVNGQAQRKQITASSFISAGETLRIPSSLWIWSDSTSIAALTIDISCTIINEGKIIGKGGLGGSNYSAGSVGGPAIKINSGVTGVTITNSSGAYIAGGGGGGGGSGGGGGAGGGTGGDHYALGGTATSTAGTGGALNASGSDGTGVGGNGGGAGGGGGDGYDTGSSNFGNYAGGGGGRILPGTGGAAGTSATGFGNRGPGGAGGSAGNAGGSSNTGSGGGGGWGASGGARASAAGGTGGKAIDDSGVTYTLSNSGTVYGGT